MSVDNLSGGAGKDTFIDTSAGLNGDTISDFQPGDRIVVSDASLSNFTVSFTNQTLKFGSASIALPGVGSGADFFVRAAAGGGVEIGMQIQFGSADLKLASFGANQGWGSDNINPRMLADVNGDGLADIVAFGNDGVHVSLANGSGGFGAPALATTAFGTGTGAGGWSTYDRYPRDVADVNGDGRADIVGFGADGVYVSLGQTNGSFAAPEGVTTAFGQGASFGGWSSQGKYPRQLADVNGDGKADIVGFGNDGVYVALAQANGTFAAPKAATTAFGFAAFAGGWSSNDQYPRLVADVNGDHRSDIVGFGNNGVYVSLGQTDGTFSAPTLQLNAFGAAPPDGWISYDKYPRELADVDGDGNVDIVGFGNDGVYIALGNGNGTFQSEMLDIGFFGFGAAAGSWSSEDAFPRHLGDINGDGAADIVGSAQQAYMSPSRMEISGGSTGSKLGGCLQRPESQLFQA